VHSCNWNWLKSKKGLETSRKTSKCHANWGQDLIPHSRCVIKEVDRLGTPSIQISKNVPPTAQNSGKFHPKSFILRRGLFVMWKLSIWHAEWHLYTPLDAQVILLSFSTATSDNWRSPGHPQSVDRFKICVSWATLHAMWWSTPLLNLTRVHMFSERLPESTEQSKNISRSTSITYRY